MKSYLIVALSILSFLFTVDVKGQSDGFAGGEIYAEYAGNYDEACGDPLPYHFIFRFYRDESTSFGIPMPLDFPLRIIEKPDPTDRNTWIDVNVGALDDIVYTNPNVPNLCVRNAFATTEGQWYRTSNPVMLNANRTFIAALDVPPPARLPNFNLAGRAFHSPENDNVEGTPLQTYYIETTFNTNCGVDTTGPLSPTPDQRVTWSNGWNETVEYVNTDIVESFCSGESYEIDLNDYIIPNFSVFTYVDTITNQEVRRDTIYDDVSFFIKRPFRQERAAVVNAPGFSTFNPFPTDPNGRFRFDQETGVLTFTPLLPLGLRGFTSAIVIETVERRKTFEKKTRPDGTDEIVEVPSDGNFVSRSQRQFRFVIGAAANCNKRLPAFSSVAPFDPITEEYLFDCTTNEFDVILSEPMLFETLDAGDFRIFRGTQFAPRDDNAWLPNEIIVDPANINRFGEFTEMTIVLDEGLGPGNYTLFTKFASNQGNGPMDDILLRNRCGFELGNDSTVYKIRIVEDNVPFYEFNDNGEAVRFCYPADEPIHLRLLDGQREDIISRVDTFHYDYRGPNSPSAPTVFDTSFVSDAPNNPEDLFLGELYTVPDDYDFIDNPLQNKPEGFWRVGIGLNYGWTYNGDFFDARCFDDDIIRVEILEHPPVEVRDYDLCIGEDWPVIRDLVDTTGVDPQFLPINYTWELFRKEKGEVEGGFVPIGSQSNTMSVNDTLKAADFAFGIDTAFLVKSLVTFPNGCVDSNIITLRRSAVQAYVAEDTIICLGQEFLLSNQREDTYLVPDSMFYEWFLDDEPIMGADSQSVMIDGQGVYKLVVTKRTDEGFCTDTTTTRVRIADSLATPEVICSKVTFQDGAIEQLFYWPVVPGADKYQVRGVAENGKFFNNAGQEVPNGVWEDANDLYGIHNRIRGAELRLEVRAVNLEVEESAPCRFGPIGIADACEVVVKEVNIFSPNGDGINDLLRFDLLEVYPGSKLQIYNRWGRLIFESNNYENDWDGDDHKEGVYFYILDIDDPRGIQDIFRGSFTLVR